MTTFSPVTESEMTELKAKFDEMFGRLATTLVGASQQGQELERVRSDLTALRDDYNNLRQAHAKAQDDVKAATDLATQAEKERDAARALHSNEQARNQHLSELMISRDQRVTELSGENASLKRELASVNRENGDLNHTVGELTGKLAVAEANLAKVKAIFDPDPPKLVREPEKDGFWDNSERHHHGPENPSSETKPAVQPEMKPVQYDDRGYEEGHDGGYKY